MALYILSSNICLCGLFVVFILTNYTSFVCVVIFDKSHFLTLSLLTASTVNIYRSRQTSTCDIIGLDVANLIREEM